MYQPTSGGKNRVFEVLFFNQTVRDLVARNESHNFFEDRWGEMQMQKVNAGSVEEARARIVRRYPPEQGFVVQAVQEEPEPVY